MNQQFESPFCGLSVCLALACCLLNNQRKFGCVMSTLPMTPFPSLESCGEGVA